MLKVGEKYSVIVGKGGSAGTNVKFYEWDSNITDAKSGNDGENSSFSNISARGGQGGKGGNTVNKGNDGTSYGTGGSGGTGAKANSSRKCDSWI